MIKYYKVLFCTDFSELSDLAFEYACELVQQHNGELHIFHSTSDVPVREKLEKAFNKRYLSSEKCKGMKTECGYSQGLDYEQIITYAKEKNVDMIVMGTHGKSGFFKDLLLGSCARQMVRRSHIPVLVVPPPERANI